MAEKHDYLVARYRAKLQKNGHRIEAKSPFVDYRPDIFATKGGRKVFVEVEIDRALYGDHTIRQLETMHKYLLKSKQNHGVLAVPRGLREEAEFFVYQVFGDGRIRVQTL